MISSLVSPLLQSTRVDEDFLFGLCELDVESLSLSLSLSPPLMMGSDFFCVALIPIKVAHPGSILYQIGGVWLVTVAKPFLVLCRNIF